MKPFMLQRRGSWVRIGALGLASLHCGTPRGADPIAEVPGAASDPGAAADPSVADPAVLAPLGAPSSDTSLPEVGGQTGDDSGQIGLECDVVTETSLALDDTSRFGFSANERIALALGAHEMPLRWVEPVYDASGGLLDYAARAARATGSIRVEVERLGDEARLLERHDSLQDVDCPPRLLADARLTLSSADGALAEAVDATLELGSDNDMVVLTASLPLESLGGNYVFEPAELGGQAPSGLHISAAFTRYGQTGAVVQQYGEAPGLWAIDGAHWPDWQPCNRWGWFPANYAERRPSVSDLLDNVRRHAPVTILTPARESVPAQLALEAVPRSGCHLPKTSGVTLSDEILSLETQVTLTSDALPGPVHVPLDLVSSFSPDMAQWHSFFSTVSTECSTRSHYSAQDFVTHCGDWGVDLSGVESAFIEIESSITPASGYVLFNIRGKRSESTPPGSSDVVELGSVRVLLGTP